MLLEHFSLVVLRESREINLVYRRESALRTQGWQRSDERAYPSLIFLRVILALPAKARRGISGSTHRQKKSGKATECLRMRLVGLRIQAIYCAAR